MLRAISQQIVPAAPSSDSEASHSLFHWLHIALAVTGSQPPGLWNSADRAEEGGAGRT